eukprot:TRINITY_DN114446_c0_g1_i1.p1 TRINITY_DN114446_c0_g1~~TRINITY_DN114446_c0_g1_i1.p1  ORF type:complete len:284 (-),score=54.23 TRINITY_DN114446_c0_g1_i1:99-950(-)
MYGLSLDETDEDEEFSGDSGWIPWFCSQKGNDFFVEIEEEYIRDNFNLYGLRGRFQYYDHALEMILSQEAPDEEELADPDYEAVYCDAKRLYGLIHARYIVSPRGLQVMREKFMKATFGCCSRVLCERQHVLPIGMSEELGAMPVRIFCPKCEQVYSPKTKHRELDGAYFGASFPQIFLQSYPSLVPLDPPRAFVPRVFGFKLHKQKSLITRKVEEEQRGSQQHAGGASASASASAGAGASASASGSGAAPAAAAASSSACATRQQTQHAAQREGGEEGTGAQ